ncbi:hypothetical protein SA496_05625 [Pseudomonas sp. JS3066]|jgi:hypothetical protein|uniref:hypothetical protein n=1 Tax=unclassified Pseudomonas TaxID=196821 RepID=UPI00129E4D99|nr:MULTISPECIES: hypothetical protein [unclassified Pseudomonas]MDH4655548.1 hypothetical protein [Pseudomonas sp. BN606]MRK19950.1 hypothetical protein [Pseudomonas sp. JG-B]WVK94667.1 hypothetical protein SA496_05625 [Pseudomonas sp. JS3066]
MEDNGWLLLAAAGTLLAAALHFGCIVFGSAWYDAMGAGERMVRLSREGRWQPTLITGAITLVLVIWALYALAGAGMLPALPAARFVLFAITVVLLLRGVAGLAIARFRPGYNGARFWIVSSATCLMLGGLYLTGTLQAWPRL